MTWPAIVLYTTLSVGDLGTTEWGIGRGAHEGNPFLQDRGVRVAVKIAQPFALTLIDSKISKPKRKWFRIGAAVVGGTVIGMNVRTGLKAKPKGR